MLFQKIALLIRNTFQLQDLSYGYRGFSVSNVPLLVSIHAMGNPSTSQGYYVAVKNRPLKTPQGDVISIPTKTLAMMVAHEWVEVFSKMKSNHVSGDFPSSLRPHSLPLTSLVSQAVSLERKNQRKERIFQLVSYLDHDSLCYPSSYPDTLVNLQSQFWDPLRSWLQSKFNVNIMIQTNQHGHLIPIKQSIETKQHIYDQLNEMDDWSLTALERAIETSRSFIIGMALLFHSSLSLKEAIIASRLEAYYQSMKWGKMEEHHDVDEAYLTMRLGSCRMLLYSLKNEK